MDYNTWSKTYWEEALRVKARMEHLQQEGQGATREEFLLRKRRLTILYEMYLDCVHTAKTLNRRAKQEGGFAPCAPKW